MSNTTATCSSDYLWSRRCSTETVFSIQGQETDFVRDTSDSETEVNMLSDNSEYEPVTESEAEAPVEEDTSAESDNIIMTKVIEVKVGDDEDADTEQTSSESDSEVDLADYWHCAQCRAENNNPRYRYCQKCFKVRKNFFPPRPKGKRKREPSIDPVPRSLSQDSGVGLSSSQGSDSQGSVSPDTGEGTSISSPRSKCENHRIFNKNINIPFLKRRAESTDDVSKRQRLDFDSGSDIDENFTPANEIAENVTSAIESVSPIVKTVSDPSISIDSSNDLKITKKILAETLRDNLDGKDLCIICFSEPKSGVFVHGRIAHICCCYKCAVKVWAKAKRCPICNCKVSNVLRAIVM